MKMKTLNLWKKYFKLKGLDEQITQQYVKYISILLNNNEPIIFSFKHLCELLSRKPSYLASAVNATIHHYREFKIPKRSGGFRKISVPYPALLECQYWIYTNILLKIPINQAAHGFTPNKSIITNAKLHTGKKALLKMDLKDFFPSIKINRIINLFHKLGYPINISYYLASLCCLNDSLPQGAPTSPYLSNIISKNLDNRLLKFSKKFELYYSRYADDITFSGNDIPAKFITYISDIIHSESFTVNKSKTRLYKGKSKRIVTGISVSENSIKLPRKYKRELKKDLYYIIKYGLQSHLAKRKINKLNYLNSIRGKLNFWLCVEPNNQKALYYLDKLNNIDEDYF